MNHVFLKISYTRATQTKWGLKRGPGVLSLSLSPLPSLTRFSATFVTSPGLGCYERSLEKDKRLCNNVLVGAQIPKALTSLQWHHVACDLEYPKTVKYTAL